MASDNKTISAKFDDLNPGMLIQLYDCLLQKLKSGGYKNRPANQWEVLENGRNAFINMTMEEKAVLLNNIIIMLRCDATTTANLTAVKGSANAGSMKKNKNTIAKNKVIIVNQSVTGLYDNRLQL